jgi:hypothetical protein
LDELVTFVNRRDRLAEGDAILYRLVCRAQVDELASLGVPTAFYLTNNTVEAPQPT